MNPMIFELNEVETPNQLEGTFYVIDAFPSLSFVTDENGELKAFERYDEALLEAEDCQVGFVISFS